MKFGKSLNMLYSEVKQSIVNESTILMQSDDAGAEVEEFNGVTSEMLNKIRRLLGTQQRSSQEQLINYLKTDKKISEQTSKRIALYIEHYSEDPQKIIDYILTEENKISLKDVSGTSVNFIQSLENKGFNKELLETLIALKEQGSGPGEYLFCIAVKNLQKRAKSTKDDQDGGDLELVGEDGGKVELKGNAGILRSGKENTFGTPIECSKYWRDELEKRLTRYGMKTELSELPQASAKPGGGKGTNWSFKINNANRLTVDIFGKQISKRIDELKNKRTEFSNKDQYALWLKNEGVNLAPTELQNEKFDENDLVDLWANGFHKLFIKADLTDIKKTVEEAYTSAAEGELGISMRESLLALNLDYYVKLDNFKYFVLFDHVQTSKTYGKAVVLNYQEMQSMDKQSMLDLISIVSAPDFSRDVVSSGAMSIKINPSLLEQKATVEEA